MYQKVRAVYRAGAFIVQESFDIPEETEVELLIQGPLILPAEVGDPEEQARLMKTIIERMQQNPIPVTAPHWTRDELHERR